MRRTIFEVDFAQFRGARELISGADHAQNGLILCRSHFRTDRRELGRLGGAVDSVQVSVVERRNETRLIHGGQFA